MRFPAIACFIVVLGITTNVGHTQSQMPAPALPNTFIDTTYSLPTGGKTWRPRSSSELKSMIDSANPGDVIVLDAKVTYEGNFTLPEKLNPDHKWIYVVSSELSQLPPAGTRVT